MLKMNHNSLTRNFLHLNTSGLSMYKVVALRKYLHSKVVALGKAHRTISNDESANFELLQNCKNRRKGGVGLLIRKSASFCEIQDLKTIEVDAVWSSVYLECFPLLEASICIHTTSVPDSDDDLPKFLREASDCCETSKIGGCMVLGD